MDVLHRLRTGVPIATIVTGILQSEEFQARHPAPVATTQEIDGLFRAAYRHAPRFAPHGQATELPICDRLHDHGLALPLHSELSDQDVDRVCEALQRALSQPADHQP